MKTVLITGCSSGIGYNLALEFASRGYIVFSCARRLESMSPLAEAYPGKIIPFSMDVSSLNSIKEGFEFVTNKLSELGEDGIDVLYNNAGSSCTFPGVDVPFEAVDQCLTTNIGGPVNVTHIFSRLVIKRQGTFAYTGSSAGYCPFPFGSVYGASKAAIGQYCSILAFELEPFNCKVKHFVTGGVDTNIADTRPLPEDSIYNIEEMQSAFKLRQEMAKRHKPMPANVYAKWAVDAIQKGYSWGWGGGVDVYLGTWSILPSLVRWLPRWTILEIFRIKFHLKDAWRVLSNSVKTD